MFQKLMFGLLFLASPVILLSQTAPTERQAKEIAAIQQRTFKPLMDQLEADKTGQFAALKVDLAGLAKAGSSAQMRELGREVERKYYAFYKKAFTAAKIDLVAYKKNVAAVLGHQKFQLDEFGGIQAEIFLPQGPPPVNFTATFTPPLTGGISEETANGVSIDCDSDITESSISVRSSITDIAGSCRSKASAGGSAELTFGTFNKVTVSARSDEFYFGMALSLGGYGQFNAKLGLRLKSDSQDKVTIVHERWCIAPVLWVATIEHDVDNHLMQATFNGNFQTGQTLVAEIYVECFSLSIANGPAGGDVSCKNIEQVRFTAGN